MRDRFDEMGLTWAACTERLAAIYRACLEGKPR
jgi:hypothetical protein